MIFIIKSKSFVLKRQFAKNKPDKGLSGEFLKPNM
jgi:hypothetical protein